MINIWVIYNLWLIMIVFKKGSCNRFLLIWMVSCDNIVRTLLRFFRQVINLFILEITNDFHVTWWLFNMLFTQNNNSGLLCLSFFLCSTKKFFFGNKRLWYVIAFMIIIYHEQYQLNNMATVIWVTFSKKEELKSLWKKLILKITVFTKRHKSNISLLIKM